MKFLPRFGKDLTDPPLRRQAIDAVLREARALYKARGVGEEAREPVLKLQDQFDQAGIDREELIAAAEAAFPQDSYWPSALLTSLLTKATLSDDEHRLLLQQAERAPARLDVWNRLFRELRAAKNDALEARARERCALGLMRYFPEPTLCLWETGGLEDQARSLFRRCLREAAEAAVAQGREDEEARELFRRVRLWFPQHPQATRQLALLAIKDNDIALRSVQVVLEAVLLEPGNLEFKLWAARALLKLPGHRTEGLGMLRQLHADQPADPSTAESLVQALKEEEAPEPQDIALLTAWYEEHPADQRILELIADHFADQQDLSPEALSYYRAASEHSPRRNRYLRLLGRASASQSEWPEVIRIYEELRAAGEGGEDVILPLASAYASFRRRDEPACAVYEEAIQAGTLQQEIHELYCMALYQNAPAAPENVARFARSLAKCPKACWPQIGMTGHYLRTRDFGRALSGALEILDRYPECCDAVELAGKALANDFSRRQLALLARGKPPVLRQIFEQAHREAPDAGPIVVGLVRRRLADNLRDQETARLLRDACRAAPDALDLRQERADLLWELGDTRNAGALYRELLTRQRAARQRTSTASQNHEKYKRCLFRLSEHLLESGSSGDTEVLVEAAADPSASKDVILGAARSVMEHHPDHPARIALLERAHRLEPDDSALEWALAEAHAAKGNPRSALRLAVRLLSAGIMADEVANLLRSALAANKANLLLPSLLEQLRALLAETRGIPAPVALAGMELILSTRGPEARDIPVLEPLHGALPRNARVRRWLARALSRSGQDTRAVEIYGSLMESGTEVQGEVLVELARTHARLGIRDREQLPVAEGAVKLKPDDSELLLHLAGIQLRIGHMATSARNLTVVLERAPELHGRVQALIMSEAPTHTPERSSLLPVLARVHVAAQRVEEALGVLARLHEDYQRLLPELVQLYSQLIDLDPDNPRPVSERAMLLRLAGQLDEALQDFDRAYRLAPDSTVTILQYAEALAQKVRAQEAPDAELCVQAGEFFVRANRDHAAQEMILLALQADKKNTNALLLQARLQLGAGLLKECRRSLKQVKEPERAVDLFEQLARAFAERGDNMQAADVLNDVMEVKGPQHELLEQLRNYYAQEGEDTQRLHRSSQALQGFSERVRGRYELREELGSGSMGVVYKAYDRELDDVVVLKILPESAADDPGALARFRHEAKAARRLAHPNIVRIHDFGEDNGRKHISMEFVSGGDLKNHLAQYGTVMPADEKLRIIREVARALAHAHGEGVLHRDIKAANILLTRSGRVKLSDFGIAAILLPDVEQPPEDREYILGTPLYMSPEQYKGAKLTPASDLYSVGILLYEMFSGRPPFTTGSIGYHHQYTPPAPIDTVPPVLWHVMENLLAKRPEDRFQSAEELLRALDDMEKRISLG